VKTKFFRDLKKHMSRDFEFLKNIIELILAVVSLLDLIGATRHLVRIAMDLYSKMTPEMKDNLIRYHQVSPEIIRQVEERFQEYTRSNLPPLMRQEALARKLKQIELKDLPITREMLYQEVVQGGYHWVQHVLPPPSFARIIPQPPRLLPLK
jgi:hypothetical protein